MGTNLRIAIFNPVQKASVARPPMAAISLAYAARRARPGTEVLIVDGQRTAFLNDLKAIAAFRPNVFVTGTYAYTKTLGRNYLERERQVIDILREARLEIPIIAGGHEASSHPAGVIDALKPQVLFTGEAEVSFAEAVRTGFNIPELNPALATTTVLTTQRGNRSIVIGANQAFDLDEFPLPTEFMSIFPEGTRWKQAAVNVGRGCVGSCTFCGGAKKPFGVMSPARVVEHLLAWESLGYSYFELLAEDFVRHPKHAGRVLRAINQENKLRGKGYFIFARPDMFTQALEQTLSDNVAARNEWERFLAENQVEIETGAENFTVNLLTPDGFGKYPSRSRALQHENNLTKMLEFAKGTEARISFDLILFVPTTSLRGIRVNYETLRDYAAQYPNLYIEPSALFRELYPYAGTPAAEIFGDGTGRLNPYEDKRVPALLRTLKANKKYYRCSDTLPLTTVLDRIIKLIRFFERNFRDSARPPSPSRIARHMEGVVGSPVYLL